MTEYTFRHINGDESTVEAEDEAEARHKAMEKRWGPAGNDRIGTTHPYQGKGLSLINEK
jgi:hypothetical protein